jgi:hypothetical protein
MRLKVCALSLLVLFSTACAVAPTPHPSPFPTPLVSFRCTTSEAKGRCGPYDDYRRVTGTTSSTYVGNNVWNAVSGARQILHATDPGNWLVQANMPARNTAVVSYPSIGANYGQITNQPTPLDRHSSIVSSFDETMNATDGTSAWAAYDIWLAPGNCAAGSTCPSYEVMIQHDFAGNGRCKTIASAEFGGSGGIPRERWHLCRYGSELIWKLGADEDHKVSVQSGTVDVLSMLTWLVDHGDLPRGIGLWLIGYGWEICSTGGVNENFQVHGFSLIAQQS